MAEIEPLRQPTPEPEPPNAAPDPAHHVRPARTFALYGAFLLAFAAGFVASREVGGTGAARIIAPAVPAGIVAGAEHPPGWMNDFADAFCNGDASYIAGHAGGELANMGEEQIAAALAKPKWTCSKIRYLGHAANTQSDNFLFVTTMSGGEEMWWAFAVIEQKVVAIQ